MRLPVRLAQSFPDTLSSQDVRIWASSEPQSQAEKRREARGESAEVKWEAGVAAVLLRVPGRQPRLAFPGVECEGRRGATGNPNCRKNRVAISERERL